MMTFSTFGCFRSLRAEYQPQVEKIRVSSDNADLVFFLDGPQAVNLRDDLSRAITEAAQQHAQTVAKARGGYDTPSGHDIGCEEFPPGAKHECSCKAALDVAKDAQAVTP